MTSLQEGFQNLGAENNFSLCRGTSCAQQEGFLVDRCHLAERTQINDLERVAPEKKVVSDVGHVAEGTKINELEAGTSAEEAIADTCDVGEWRQVHGLNLGATMQKVIVDLGGPGEWGEVHGLEAVATAEEVSGNRSHACQQRKRGQVAVNKVFCTIAEILTDRSHGRNGRKVHEADMLVVLQETIANGSCPRIWGEVRWTNNGHFRLVLRQGDRHFNPQVTSHEREI
jgi:hypothetical protein